MIWSSAMTVMKTITESLGETVDSMELPALPGVVGIRR